MPHYYLVIWARKCEVTEPVWFGYWCMGRPHILQVESIWNLLNQKGLSSILRYQTNSLCAGHLRRKFLITLSKQKKVPHVITWFVGTCLQVMWKLTSGRVVGNQTCTYGACYSRRVNLSILGSLNFWIIFVTLKLAAPSSKLRWAMYMALFTIFLLSHRFIKVTGL